MQDSRSIDRNRGMRAEEVAHWYFRLNGFLSIPGFIIHPDREQRHPYTEADLIAVRFPYSTEILNSRAMKDDQLLLELDCLPPDSRPPRTTIVLVEVKTDLCRINGPWSNSERGNMQRVIRRLGFAAPEHVEKIAQKMYLDLRWEDKHFVLQYVAVGSRFNDGLQVNYPKLVQITFEQIADFLYDRFLNFPEKLPTGPIHEQWPDFGRYYGEKFRHIRGNKGLSRQVIETYIGSR